MQKKTAFVLPLLAAAIMSALCSCGGFFEEEQEQQEVLLPAPTVKTGTAGNTISCNASGSDNILWINIFRRNVTSGDANFVNIGQILPYTGVAFSNSAQFEDIYVAKDGEYEYYIRYAKRNGSQTVYERTEAKKVTTVATASAGELNAASADAIPLTYDETDYTLTGTAPTFDNAPADAKSTTCLAVSNGARTIPIEYKLTDNKLHLKNFLPRDFLDVPITLGHFVLQVEVDDSSNKLITYYWSLPLEVEVAKDAGGEALESITIPSNAVVGSDIDYTPDE